MNWRASIIVPDWLPPTTTTTFVYLVKQLPSDMKACMTFNGSLSGDIAVHNGVKQGDILVPTLFSIWFTVLLSHAFEECEAEVSLRFRTSRKVFNIRRFNTKSKNFESPIRYLLSSDDVNFIAHTEYDWEAIMDRFSTTCVKRYVHPTT